MTNEHRRSAQWLVMWRPLVLILALFGAAFAAASCEETGPSPVGVHPNDAGPGEPAEEEDAGEDAGEGDAEAEDGGEDAGETDAAGEETDAGDAGDADADAT